MMHWIKWKINEEMEENIMCTKGKRQPITKKERAIVYGRAHGMCQMCGKELLFGQMTVYHIVPLDKGGKNTLVNYQCLCQ